MSTVSVLGLDRNGLNRVLFRQPGPEHCSGAVYLHSGWFTGNSLHIQVNQSITSVEAPIRPSSSTILTWEFITVPGYCTVRYNTCCSFGRLQIQQSWSTMQWCGYGCLSRILDPNFSILDLGSRIQGRKDSGFRVRIRIKEFKYF